jgi:NAD(P)-dependent dehydrogenase (short-subunit alcohol dehydrogenase family)
MSFWKNKVAIVTGGSRGLGHAIASSFATAGARVFIADLDADSLARCAGQLRSKGADVTTLPADVTDQMQVEAMVGKAVERYGRLDVLVNNVGRSMRSEVLNTSPEDFQALWVINFLSTVRCTRAAASHLLATQGHVVNIGSLAAKAAGPHLGAYPAAKHAVAAYSQQLRLELGPRGLHVLLVCPGPLKRQDAGQRYADQAAGLPAAAGQPGGGTKLSLVDPDWLGQKILRCCERRKPELVVPFRARLLFALAQLSPKLGDWIIRKKT